MTLRRPLVLSIALNESFNGDGTVVSYLNNVRRDNHRAGRSSAHRVAPDEVILRAQHRGYETPHLRIMHLSHAWPFERMEIAMRFRLSIAAAATRMMAEVGATTAVPSYDVVAFPIPPHQFVVLGPTNAQERGPAAALTLAG